MDISTSAREVRSTEDAGQGELKTEQGRASATKNGDSTTEFVARNWLTIALIASADWAG